METVMKRIVSMTLLAAAAFMLAGCPKKPTVSEAPTARSQVPASATTTGAGGATTRVSPLGDGSAASGYGADAAANRARNTIYFDFDKSEIKPEFADLVTQAAKNLASHPQARVKLEGNTDERGTREYNIGLGERRAQAVRRALMLQGVAESQITTVSFGAERPAVEGDDETAWAQNRRVELNYSASTGQ
jgi:peptidoglycan-associated lipoprotein